MSRQSDVEVSASYGDCHSTCAIVEVCGSDDKGAIRTACCQYRGTVSLLTCAESNDVRACGNVAGIVDVGVIFWCVAICVSDTVYLDEGILRPPPGTAPIAA